MELAKVIGTVVSDRHVEGFENAKLLVIQPLNYDLTERGIPLVAWDTVNAGRGSTVVWVGGKEAVFATGREYTPVDASIIAIWEPSR
ncbi:MAG: EutN/CcmL family microcompartment protein [bacterium]|nr:EutN/CcmL family microcompartment protein [bacterium]